MLVSESEWRHFYTVLKGVADVDFSLYKQEQLRRRIFSLVEARKLGSLRDLARILEQQPAELRNFLDRMAINVSELFRNPDKWHEVERVVLPELLRGSSRLKCWSAGCSYGAEAHSLAAILHANFGTGHTIIGTDIDKAALHQAQAGRFNNQDMKGVPANYRRYFVKSGDEYVATPEIKRILSFRYGNLLADRFETGFDLILCRNVVIYFNDEAKNDLYRKFFDALKPGGILFVGGTERIYNAKEIGFGSPVPFFYSKPIGGERAWRNAS